MDGWIITKIRVDSKWHRQNLEILKFKIIKKLSFNYIEKQRARQKQSVTEKMISYVCFFFLISVCCSVFVKIDDIT